MSFPHTVISPGAGVHGWGQRLVACRPDCSQLCDNPSLRLLSFLRPGHLSEGTLLSWQDAGGDMVACVSV